MFPRLLQSAKRTHRPGRRRSGTAATSRIERLEDRSLLSSVTVNLGATQDGTLYEDDFGNVANGGGSHFFAGPNASAIRRGLIQFDVASAVPEGSVITDAVLTLHNSGGVKHSRNVFLHNVRTQWSTGPSDAPRGEFAGTSAENGDATWTHTFFGDQFWSNPGGDYGGRIASTPVVLPGFYEWTSDRMIETVQDWLDKPESNFGWLLTSNETTRSVKRFDSSEHPNESRQPELSVTYETPVLAASIEGRKWHDQNVNGQRDGSEPWLNGWTIELYDANSGQLLESTVTADVDLNEDGFINPETERGYYSFTVLPGTYTIREVMQDGWSQSYPGFAADFGREGRASASGAMTLTDGVLYFDFDVDHPNGRPLLIDFFVPDGNGGERLIDTRPSQGPGGEGRIVGSVPLTPVEISHLLNGELTAAVLNNRGRVKAKGPVGATGSHIVTLSSGELITDRNFGNYQPGDVVPPGPPPSQTSADFASRGVHFGVDELGRITIVIAPQNPILVSEDSNGSSDDGIGVGGGDGESESIAVTPRQIAGILKYAAKRDAGIAEALDRLFGGADPLEILA